ncbi:MAG TPA: LysR family transcriptional regulator [Caulobacteraceae bacterium]|jgi:DNA-binding transcriptional LysR family regulator|nr:LysR family transcriptional regulator [Caulobacteraceae bacterium]
MAFDHRQLRAFLAIVDHGGLGRAAAHVNLSQSALTRLVQDMEARLGVPLFERSRRGMTPTSFGEALTPHARLLLFEMGQAVDTLDALRGVRRGTLRIGALAAVSRTFLPGAVASLLQKSPLLQVELLEGAEDRLLAALQGKSIDLMIASTLPPDEEITPVGACGYEDYFSVFCSAEHRLAAAPAVTLGEVLAQTWIMPPRGAAPRLLFEEAVRATGRPIPRVAIESTSPSAMVAFVARTACLGWLPRPLFASEEQTGQVRVLEAPELVLRRRFFVYRRSRGLLPAAASQFLAELPLTR